MKKLFFLFASAIILAVALVNCGKDKEDSNASTYPALQGKYYTPYYAAHYDPFCQSVMCIYEFDATNVATLCSYEDTCCTKHLYCIPDIDIYQLRNERTQLRWWVKADTFYSVRLDDSLWSSKSAFYPKQSFQFISPDTFILDGKWYHR